MQYVEDLNEFALWHNGRALSKLVFAITKVNPLAEDTLLQQQCKQNVIQLMTQIAECSSLSSKKALQQHLQFIRKKGLDLKCLMTTLFDIGYTSATTNHEVQVHCDRLLDEVGEVQYALKRHFQIGFLEINL